MVRSTSFPPTARTSCPSVRCGRRINIMITILSVILACSILAACGGSTPATSASTPTSAAIVATPTDTPTPTPTPTSTPTPVPTPIPPPPAPPTQPPPSPAILGLTPASMFIGGTSCAQNATFFFCSQPVVTNLSTNQDMRWSASSNFGASFSPAGGVLGPQQSVRITVTIRRSGCGVGTLFFVGPLNTHTIAWNCHG